MEFLRLFGIWAQSVLRARRARAASGVEPAAEASIDGINDLQHPPAAERRSGGLIRLWLNRRYPRDATSRYRRGPRRGDLYGGERRESIEVEENCRYMVSGRGSRLR
jgi:hypothetical protein